MRFKSFKELDIETERLSGQDKVNEILSLLENAEELLPEAEFKKHFFKIASSKAIYYYSLKEYEKFYDTVRHLIDNGFACGKYMMRRLGAIPDINSLELMEKNDVLIDREQRKAKFRYEVHLPEGYTETKKFPVFFALHGDGMDGNIDDVAAYWKPDIFLKKGFIFVYPQSSQVYCHNGYQWCSDIDTARREISSCIDLILQKYSVDQENVLVGGFSGGAMASIDFAMVDAFPIRGIIAHCPGKILESFSVEGSKRAAERGMRSVIMEGELDLEPSVQEVIDIFGKVGLPCEYVINKNVGHFFPENFSEKLEMALNFILK